jgi:hypothetical protein
MYTTEGWTGIYTAVWRCFGLSGLVTLLFVAHVYFGGFVVMELALAVVNAQFVNARAALANTQRRVMRQVQVLRGGPVSGKSKAIVAREGKAETAAGGEGKTETAAVREGTASTHPAAPLPITSDGTATSGALRSPDVEGTTDAEGAALTGAPPVSAVSAVVVHVHAPAEGHPQRRCCSCQEFMLHPLSSLLRYGGACCRASPAAAAARCCRRPGVTSMAPSAQIAACASPGSLGPLEAPRASKFRGGVRACTSALRSRVVLSRGLSARRC